MALTIEFELPDESWRKVGPVHLPPGPDADPIAHFEHELRMAWQELGDRSGDVAEEPFDEFVRDYEALPNETSRHIFASNAVTEFIRDRFEVATAVAQDQQDSRFRPMGDKVPEMGVEAIVFQTGPTRFCRVERHFGNRFGIWIEDRESPSDRSIVAEYGMERVETSLGHFVLLVRKDKNLVEHDRSLYWVLKQLKNENTKVFHVATYIVPEPEPEKSEDEKPAL